MDRIEKIIETMVRAQRDREEASAKQRDRDEVKAKAKREREIAVMAKAQHERDEAMAKAQRERDEAMAKAQRERDLRWEKEHAYHDREIRRIDARLSRFVKLGVEEARRHRVRMRALDEQIKQLTAAQVVTEEKLQRFISSLGTNGFGSRS